MNEILNNNLKILEKTNPELARHLESLQPNPNIEVIHSNKDGKDLYTAQVTTAEGNKILLHSRYNPVLEAKRIIDKYEIGLLDTFIVFGFGMGYHIDELFRRTSNKSTIFIIEESADIFLAALSVKDLSHLLASNRICLLVNKSLTEITNGMAKDLEPYFHGNIHLILHPPSFQAFKTQYEAIKSAVIGFINFAKITLETTLILPQFTLVNELTTLPLYACTPDIKIIKDRFKGYPAIVVSAGPSLYRNIELLKELRGKAIVIAVSTTFKLLLRKGIIPDFACVLDYHEVSRRYFEDVGPTDTILVAGANASPSAILAHQGPVLFYNNDNLALILKEMKLSKDTMPRGATVAHLAYFLAEYIGADPIMFVGQDLAHPDGITHMPGTPIHEEWEPELHKFHTLEMKEWEQIIRMRNRLHKVTDIHGTQIYSDAQMIAYLRFFEQAFANARHTIIDATEGGVRKAYTKITTLREAIDLYCAQTIPENIFDYKHDTKWIDSSLLPKALECVNARIAEGNAFGSKIKSIHRLLNKMQKALNEQSVFDSLHEQMKKVNSDMGHLATFYSIVSSLIQSDEMLRNIRDRELEVSTKTGEERRKQSLVRDVDFALATTNGQETVMNMLYEARKKLENFKPVWPGILNKKKQEGNIN